MQIEIVNVGVPQQAPGKKYQFLEIAYKDNGAMKGKKLMDFANPAVFKAVQSFKQGDVVEVNTVKNEKGYWDWTGFGPAVQAGPDTSTAAQSSVGTASPAAKPVSNYETREERTARQQFIIRQSSLGHALTFNEGKKVDLKTILETADAFVEYVYNEPKKVPELDDFENDVI